MLLPNVNIQNGWWREEGPYILLGYLQFAFNTSLVLVALYLLLSFLYMLRGDIQDRSREASFELHQSILHCSEAYIQNRCAPETRVPALDARCREWEYCMNKDAKVVGVARVGAETLAEVVNGFVETVSWRTMVSKSQIEHVPPCVTTDTLSCCSSSSWLYSPYSSRSQTRPSPHTAAIIPNTTPYTNLSSLISMPCRTLITERDLEYSAG